MLKLYRKLGKAENDCNRYPDIAHAARLVLSAMNMSSQKADKLYEKMNKKRLGEKFTIGKMCLKRMATSALFDLDVNIDVSNPMIE